MASEGLSASVAELFAIMGLDTTPLNEGLRNAEIKMADSANKQIISIRRIEDAYKTFPDLFAAIATSYGKMGKGIEQANADMLAGLRLIQETKRQEAALAAQQIANRKETIALQQIQRNLDESRAAAQAAYRSADLRETRSIQDIRKRLNDEIVKQQELESKGTTLGGTGSGGFMFQHLLASVALYGAIDFARESLGRPIQLQREAAQTGYGVEGVQRLQYAAAKTGTPLEMATGSIARLQERVGDMNPKTKKALSDLGLDAEKFKRQLETGPIQAVTLLAQKIDGLSNATAKQSAIFDLFGGRTGEVSLFISELAKGAEQGVILTDKQTEAVARLAREWATVKLEALSYFAMFVGDVLDRSKRSESETGAALGSGATVAGAVAGASLGIRIPGPFPLKVGAAALGAIGGAMGVNYGLNQLGAGDLPTPNQPPAMPMPDGAKPIELAKGEQAAIQKTLGDRYRWMEKERKQQEAEEKRRAAEEARRMREMEAFYQRTMEALNELGASSKLNSIKMGMAFDTLTVAFGRGLISIQELTDATATYFSMIEDNLARPGLQDAIRMFEQGLIGPDELLKARSRARALDTRGDAEQAFIKGDLDPQGLKNAQSKYRRSLRDFAPGNNKDYYLGPGGSVISNPRELGLPPGSPGDYANRARQSGTINVIPMDKFSEDILRHWQRQGGQFR